MAGDAALVNDGVFWRAILDAPSPLEAWRKMLELDLAERYRGLTAACVESLWVATRARPKHEPSSAELHRAYRR